MNKRITLLSLLAIAAFTTTKAQMTVGGSYKPSHTLVVKGQVKVDTLLAGSLSDSVVTIGADSVMHKLNMNRFVKSSVVGTLSTNAGNNLALGTNNYTNSFITLPPGKWAVHIAMTIALSNTTPSIPSGTSIWVRSTLSSSSTTLSTATQTDIVGTAKLVSGGATGPIDYGLVTGTLIVNNTSGANKTYYYWQTAGNAYSGVVAVNLGLASINLLSGSAPTSITSNTSLYGFGTNIWGEDQIYATPIN